MSYRPTIGLEIHAELKTTTKLFCNSKNDPDETRPNVNVCPICMGHPGTLPVLNREAILHVLRVGTALGGEVADYTEFDRKNYFYPDIPKGYQISQYAHPLIRGGELTGVSITRVHLEEDTARSTHEEGSSSLVDFNRAGVPLMELVTEPVVKSAEEAGQFARELQLLLRYLDAGEANMEKGEMRVEANVSVSKDDTLGTKVEVKNLNSFRTVERAIQYEIQRQSALLEKGESVTQETRGWDEKAQKTFSQRLKEESQDYRYFPDPDIPKLKLSEILEFSREELKKDMPELPLERLERYKKEFGLKEEDALMYVRNSFYGDFFEEVAQKLNDDPQKIARAANYISSDLAGLYQKVPDSKERVTPDAFVEIIEMLSSDELSSRGAKDLLAHIVREGGDPKALAEQLGLLQKNDEEELQKVVQTIIEEHVSVVEEYRSGKEASLQYLIGQGMKITKGSANPELLKKLFIEKLAQ